MECVSSARGKLLYTRTRELPWWMEASTIPSAVSHCRPTDSGGGEGRALVSEGGGEESRRCHGSVCMAAGYGSTRYTVTP